MEPNTIQPIETPQQPNKVWRWLILCIIIILILGGGYLAYTKNMTNKKNVPDIDKQEVGVLNENASIILTKEFNYPSEKPATMYSLPYQMGGALSYKVFINGSLVGSGQPKFGSAGSELVGVSMFKDGLNMLRLEINPHPETGAFDKNSACDVAIIGANKGDIVSTMIEENENILARITCTTFPNVTPEQAQVIREQAEEAAATIPEPTVPTSDEIQSAKAALLEIRAILEHKDIPGAKKYFIENSMKAQADIMDGDQDQAAEYLGMLFSQFKSIDKQGLNNSSLEWTKQINSVGFTIVIVDGVKNPPNPKAGENYESCYFSVVNNNGRWLWVYTECSLQ